jgi:dipeptidyl aminopeptidase/acylaminoacyl peptidase
VDLVSGASRVVFDPAADWLPKTRQGQIQPWSCTVASGVELDGRVYLPPGFDPAKKYPAIVNYYAGTTPLNRAFGGRYPKEWWASLGYVVYVPQPSGATGYGQAHSARHVNEWGSLVVDEIIDATRQFLAAHPFVDPQRVGCIGASYGGFTTMAVVTRTDLFAAAVSHAGISSISSYWGEGYWGYTYNARSAAESFPWNRQDLYVGQSPLFAADKVKTPILLTHGTADTNVPVGESDTFFTALKLLGAPVEYLQVEGLDHLILDHAKRIVWSRAIVAWFDRHLKGEAGWWEDLGKVPAKEKK